MALYSAHSNSERLCRSSPAAVWALTKSSPPSVRAPVQVFRGHARAGAYRNDKEYSMSQIGEPLRIIEVEPLEEPVPEVDPLEEPVPEKEVPFEQPADPVKEPA